MLTVTALVLATFASEDAACVTAGLLIQRGELDAFSGVAACALGIFLGDVSLWALGRFGRRFVLGSRWLDRRLPADRLDRAQRRLANRPAMTILGSRILPGTRLPVYLGSGLLGLPALTFIGWAAVAAALWAPIPVLLSAAAGQAAGRMPGGPAWLAPIAAGVVMLALLSVAPRIVRAAATRLHAPWRRIAIAFHRLRRWEFWPAWLFYVPVVAWIACLIVRYRGMSAIAAANPAIPDGGFVGESKFDILTRLPAEWTIPSVRIDPAAPATRIDTLRRLADASGWTLPFVLKPDAGQRGYGVEVASSWPSVEGYLARVSGPVLVQPYHPGPGEAGIYYARHPEDGRGRILAITDKRFPFVVGDGRTPIATLIDNHPRYRLQASLFLTRPGVEADRILAAGERLTLTGIGNHAQGTVFHDGTHLWTPALDARIDEIARACAGFHVGRFDVRYGDVEAFKAGRDLAIVELNGVTGEPTNIYDPEASLVSAYRALFRQWSLVFSIGHANQIRGAIPGSGRRLLSLILSHLVSRPA